MAKKTPPEQGGNATMTFDEARAQMASGARSAAYADPPAEPSPAPDPQPDQPPVAPSSDPEPMPTAAKEQPPAPSSRPPIEDGPGPVNNAGQRVAVSFEPQNADEMYRYAQMLGRSTLLPRSFYDRDDKEKRHARIADVHFVLMKGHALGLHPMTSIGNINIIDGKAEVGALLMLSIVRRSGVMAVGGWKLVHSDDRRAVYKTLRVGDDDWTEFEYTIEEAEQMGLLDKGRDEWAKANNQWRKQPRTMLRRRCQSMLLREVYPDVVLGLYDHDELSEMRDRERALGIDPDRVIPMNGLAGAQPALVEGQPGPIANMQRFADASKQSTRVDPLKQRLAERRAQNAEPQGGRVVRCSLCDAPLDPRDSDPCIGCRTEAPALDSKAQPEDDA